MGVSENFGQKSSTFSRMAMGTNMRWAHGIHQRIFCGSAGQTIPVSVDNGCDNEKHGIYVYVYVYVYIYIHIYIYVYTGWWFGTFFIFPYLGNLIIPIDFHIFQRGSNHQPVYIYIYRDIEPTT